MKKYDITISTILMVVAAGLFTASSGLPEVEGAIGAGTWPRVLAVLLFLLSALLMVQALTGHSSQEEPLTFTLKASSVCSRASASSSCSACC